MKQKYPPLSGNLLAKIKYPLLFIAALAVTSCGSGGGGGGGGGSSSTPTPTVVATATPTPTPTVEVTPTPTPTTALDKVALSGSVASFPDTSESVSNKRSLDYAAGAYKRTMTGLQKTSFMAGDSLSSSDMVPASALVSLFLLSDVDYENPVATVATDVNGNYTVTAADVVDFLTANNLVQDGASESEIISAFQALGRLQVRALIVKGDGGSQRALAIQSIADPSNIDENGDPIPVAVNPIVHRVTKSIVDQIRTSIQSLKDLGIADSVIGELTNNIVNTVSSEIARVVQESATSTIEIPEGQTIDSVIQQQENELVLNSNQDDIDQLKSVIDGTAQDQQQTIRNVQQTVLKAPELIAREDSILSSSLDSDSQGLLAGLESTMTQQVTDEVDQKIENTEDLSTVLNLDGMTAEEVLQAQAAEKTKLLRRSLSRLFLSMGLAVVVDQNEAGDAGVIAITLPSPPQIPAASLPGGRGFGDRNIRLFKVGSGTLDAGSDYTSDAGAALGTPNADGVPQAPLYYAPALSDVVTSLLNGETLDNFQISLDSAFARITTGTGTEADFTVIDRVRLYHDLNRRLDEASLVSTAVVDALIANKSKTIKIKGLASILANNFIWVKEGVSFSPEGLPMYSGRITPLESSSTINSSELALALSLTLPDTASAAAAVLTEKVGFYAQFASEAVQTQLQQAKFIFEQSGAAEPFALEATLLDIYPETAAGYRDLVLGTVDTAPDPSYFRARDRVVRGLTTAVPSTLFGRTLTGESEINVRSALFFLNFLIRSEFLIDSSTGFFKSEMIGGSNRFVPNFGNIKFMEPKDNVTVTSLMAKILGVSTITNSDFFGSANTALMSGLGELPQLPEFKEQNVGDFIDDSARATTVNAMCTVEMFDGSDPQSQLQLAVYPVTYNENTGAFQKGTSALDVGITSELVTGTGANGIPARRTYTLANLSSEISTGVFGRDYLLRFSIDSYSVNLPELYFWVDGFAPNINLCDSQFPMFIGPNMDTDTIPGMGLVSDQSRFGFDGTEQPEGLDISNFTKAGGLTILTPEEEALGEGKVDFTFNTSGTDFAINASTSSSVGFAPLFGAWVDGKLEVSLTDSASVEPLFDMRSVLGSNIRSTIEALAADDSALTSSITLTGDPDQFEHNRLYLMRDAEGKHWIIEVRFLDVFDEQGETRGRIDMGFTNVNALGVITVPDLAFDDSVGGGDGGIFYEYLLYGDWLVLEPPTGYDGPHLLEPEEVSIGDNSAWYNALESATDGITLRYSSEHFEQNITSVDSFDTVFGVPADYSSIPVTLNAGRSGVTFAKLSFDKTNKTWVMDPSPANAASYTTTLRHNNLVAVFSDDAESPQTPVYIGRVIRDKPADDPYANWELNIEWINFAEAVAENSDPQNNPDIVVCLLEQFSSCPDNHVELVYASDLTTAVGSVFDGDADGVPAVFDPNDQDPYVPGNVVGGGTGGGGFAEGVDVVVLNESDGNSGIWQSLLLQTFGAYPGEIESVNLMSSQLFGDETSQSIFTCNPPAIDANGEFTEYACAVGSATGIEIQERYSGGDGVGYSFLIPAGAIVDGRIELDYEMNFRAPTEIDGSPVMCGDQACPARPTISGHHSVFVPDSANVTVLEDLTISVGGNPGESFKGLESLDVGNDFVVSGEMIADAHEYELNVSCPASAPGDEIWMPEENLSFYAPAKDDAGNVKAPSFYLSVPWIGDRTCNFSMLARLENAVGEFAGYSLVVIPEVQTTGGDSSCIGCEPPLAQTKISDGAISLGMDPATGELLFGSTSANPVVDFSVSVSSISVSVPMGDTTSMLRSYDPMTGQVSEAGSFDFPRDGSFITLEYIAADGHVLVIDLNDMGAEVEIMIWNGGDQGGPGGPEPVDMDGDGWFDQEDNCPVIANADQLDTDQDGLGDVCDVVVPDMSGLYRVDLTRSGATEFDEDTGACVDIGNESFIVDIKMQGNQIFLHVVGEDEKGGGLAGVMQASGDFEMFAENDSFVSSNGVFTEATGSFAFTFNETTGPMENPTQCSETGTSVSGTPPTDVTEQTVMQNGGIAWFESDTWDDGTTEFEYGIIVDGALEEYHFWDDLGGSWITDDTSDQEVFLTANGLEIVDDVYVISGYVNAGETAILEASSGGSAAGINQQHVDLKAFDISGIPVLAILGEDWGYGISPDATFGAGAIAYAATITVQSDQYSLWCDNEWLFSLGMDCANAITTGTDMNGEPIAATTLDDAVFSDTELSSGMVQGQIWAGEGYDEMGGFEVFGVIVSADGNISGANLRVVFFKDRHDGTAPMQVGEVSVVVGLVGAISVFEFSIPEDVMHMTDLDMEDAHPFFFLDEQGESTFGPVVREGRKSMAGESMHELILNSTARDEVVNGFSPSAAF